MSKPNLKKEIVEFCINTLEKSVKDIRETITEIIQTANEYEGDHDMFDPFKEEMMKKKDLQIKQMEKFLDDIKLIKKVDIAKQSDKVEFGAIIITDKQKMFVSAALGKIIFHNETYYVISTQVPVFKAMRDLKKGDAFTINSNKFTIKEIF